MQTLNIELQSQYFILHHLYQKVSTEYKNILSFFLREEFLMTATLSTIDPNDKQKYKNIEDIYLGGRAVLFGQRTFYK